MMITDADAEKALHYLKDTDLEAAELRSQVAYLDEMRKIVRAELFLEYTGTIPEREAQALKHPKYRDSVLALQVGTANYETLRNRRFTASQQIEIWRSENANRRSGNI